MTALAKQVNLDTAPQPGQNTPEKVKEFHDALENALRTLSRLAPHEFSHPSIQSFIERTVSLKVHLKTQLDKLYIAQFIDRIRM